MVLETNDFTIFKSFSSIELFESPVTIWEKLDGTNGQISISGDQMMVGSRNRWITPEDDNFGFAKWAYERKEDLIRVLGDGRHFGEWVGSGIQRTYGLKDKRFVLFHTKATELIQGLDICPILHEGLFKEGLVDEMMTKLKDKGSVYAPGFMKPEGVVVRFHRNGSFFKKYFKEEKVKADKPKRESIDVSVYLQKERLESVLSKEENLRRNYPETIVDITKLYVEDLVKESFEEIHDDVLKVVKQKLFGFIKANM